MGEESEEWGSQNRGQATIQFRKNQNWKNDKHCYKHNDFSMQNYKDIFDNLTILLFNNSEYKCISLLKVNRPWCPLVKCQCPLDPASGYTLMPI